MIPMLSDPGATKGFPEGLKGKPRLEPGVRRDGASARLWEIATLMLGEGGAGVGGYSPPPGTVGQEGACAPGASHGVLVVPAKGP